MSSGPLLSLILVLVKGYNNILCTSYNLHQCSVVSQKLKGRHLKDEGDGKGKIRDLKSADVSCCNWL